MLKFNPCTYKNHKILLPDEARKSMLHDMYMSSALKNVPGISNLLIGGCGSGKTHLLYNTIFENHPGDVLFHMCPSVAILEQNKLKAKKAAIKAGRIFIDVAEYTSFVKLKNDVINMFNEDCKVLVYGSNQKFERNLQNSKELIDTIGKQKSNHGYKSSLAYTRDESHLRNTDDVSNIPKNSGNVSNPIYKAASPELESYFAKYCSPLTISATPTPLQLEEDYNTHGVKTKIINKNYHKSGFVWARSPVDDNFYYHEVGNVDSALKSIDTCVSKMQKINKKYKCKQVTQIILQTRNTTYNLSSEECLPDILDTLNKRGIKFALLDFTHEGEEIRGIVDTDSYEIVETFKTTDDVLNCVLCHEEYKNVTVMIVKNKHGVGVDLPNIKYSVNLQYRLYNRDEEGNVVTYVGVQQHGRGLRNYVGVDPREFSIMFYGSVSNYLTYMHSIGELTHELMTKIYEINVSQMYVGDTEYWRDVETKVKNDNYTITEFKEIVEQQIGTQIK